MPTHTQVVVIKELEAEDEECSLVIKVVAPVVYSVSLPDASGIKLCRLDFGLLHCSNYKEILIIA